MNRYTGYNLCEQAAVSAYVRPDIWSVVHMGIAAKCCIRLTEAHLERRRT